MIQVVGDWFHAVAVRSVAKILSLGALWTAFARYRCDNNLATLEAGCVLLLLREAVCDDEELEKRRYIFRFHHVRKLVWLIVRLALHNVAAELAARQLDPNSNVCVIRRSSPIKSYPYNLMRYLLI